MHDTEIGDIALPFLTVEQEDFFGQAQKWLLLAVWAICPEQERIKRPKARKGWVSKEQARQFARSLCPCQFL
jgi:hypothetical protein